MSQVVPIVLGASKLFKGTKSTLSKESVQLFNYDFLNLIMQLVVYFGLAWLIGLVYQAKSALGKPNPINTGIGAVAGIGGYIISSLIQHWVSTNQTTTASVRQPVLEQLFGDGYTIGQTGVKIKYWDIVKIGAVLMVVWEWYNLDRANKANGGTVSPLTHGIFALITIGLGLWTLPQLLTMFKGLNLGAGDLT